MVGHEIDGLRHDIIALARRLGHHWWYGTMGNFRQVDRSKSQNNRTLFKISALVLLLRATSCTIPAFDRFSAKSFFLARSERDRHCFRLGVVRSTAVL